MRIVLHDATKGVVSNLYDHKHDLLITKNVDGHGSEIILYKNKSMAPVK